MRTEQVINIDGETLFTLGQASKLLNLGIGRNRLMKLFRTWGLLLRNNEPAQNLVDRKYMVYVLKEIPDRRNGTSQIPVTYVTIQGLAYLQRLINRKFQNQNRGVNHEHE